MKNKKPNYIDCEKQEIKYCKWYDTEYCKKTCGFYMLLERAWIGSVVESDLERITENEEEIQNKKNLD